MKVLVAGFGNVLRGDDGFGVAVARRLMAGDLPVGVRVVEVGIGGIHLVQELFDPVDALVVIDALDLGRRPGTVLVLEPDVLDVEQLPAAARRDELADMHYATPDRALMLARAVGVLPASTWMVGCQLTSREQLGEGLSPAVDHAVGVAVDEVHTLVSELGVAWSDTPGDGR